LPLSGKREREREPPRFFETRAATQLSGEVKEEEEEKKEGTTTNTTVVAYTNTLFSVSSYVQHSKKNTKIVSGILL
jgi:hypothetical protein